MKLLNDDGGKWTRVRWDRPSQDGGPLVGWVLRDNIKPMEPPAPLGSGPKPEPEPEPEPELELEPDAV